MTSDEILMLEFQRVSLAAFDKLFARYRKPRYGSFARPRYNPERSDDLVRETMVAVIRAASRDEPRASLRTCLYGIALKLPVADCRNFLARSALGKPFPQGIDGTCMGNGESLDRQPVPRIVPR